MLRSATKADLPLLLSWGEEPHVRASAPDLDWDWGADLERPETGREYFIAELGGRPIGLMEICDPATEDSQYWGSDAPPNHRALDIWIGPADALGKGYGTGMMHLALERCFADPSVEAVLLDPLANNLGAQRFYERLGFCFVEARWFDGDYCHVYRLTRQDWQARHP